MDCTVFLTYNNEVSGTGNAILGCVQFLRSNGVAVCLDSTEDRIRGLAISEWIDEKLKMSKFVIVFINEQYWDQVRKDEVEDTLDCQHLLHTTYIYRQIHSKYIEDCSKNYNILPVVMEGCKMKHVPSWLRDTVIYTWPYHKHAILARIHQRNNMWPLTGKLTCVHHPHSPAAMEQDFSSGFNDQASCSS